MPMEGQDILWTPDIVFQKTMQEFIKMVVQESGFLISWYDYEMKKTKKQ